MKSLKLFIALFLLPQMASAYYKFSAVNADGITLYYNYTSNGTELEVADGDYSGSVVIPEEVTYMNRTRKVTSIGDNAFYECTSLTSITIPNSVKSIGDYAFFACTSLTSITIPDRVTSIGQRAFKQCTGLTSITIPDSVKSIGKSAFIGCTGLESVTLSDSIDSIGSLAFRNCNALTSITIPKSIKFIGESAFDCSNLSVVVSQIEDPFVTEVKNTRFFSQNTYYNATLYVPVGTIDKYRAAEGWKDFLYIEEGTGPEGTTPEIPKCANPTISYLNGVLTFDCKTEGATCEYSITDNDIKAGSGNEVQLTTTYDISVYAAKTGYKNSDIVTATLCWIETEPKTEDITSGVAKVSALPVLIQAQDGIITVKGINDGALVSAYDINGKHEGVGVGNHGVANIETSLKTGNVAIVSIGMKSIKVVMR